MYYLRLKMLIHRPRIRHLHEEQGNGLAQKILWGLPLWKAFMVFGARAPPSWWIFDFRKKSQAKKRTSVNFRQKYIFREWILCENNHKFVYFWRKSQWLMGKVDKSFLEVLTFYGKLQIVLHSNSGSVNKLSRKKSIFE